MTPLRYTALFLLLALAGCSGYTLGEGGSSVLAPEYRTITIDEVHNPTTLSWLEPEMRKLLRDELNNRGTINWTDERAKADAVISINITRYNRPHCRGRRKANRPSVPRPFWNSRRKSAPPGVGPYCGAPGA